MGSKAESRASPTWENSVSPDWRLVGSHPTGGSQASQIGRGQTVALGSPPSSRRGWQKKTNPGRPPRRSPDTEATTLRLIKPEDIEIREPEPAPESPTASPRARSTPRTRVMSLLALVAVVAALASLGHTAYRAITDSFVAPMILSPDNDVVVQNKVKVGELEMDRARAVGEAEGIEADLASAEKGIARLTELETMATQSLTWTRNINAHQASAGSADLGALSSQRAVLAAMIAKQKELTTKAQANLEAGVISQADFAKETQALDQMRLALLENGRTTAQSTLAMHQIKLGQDSLSGQKGAPPMPELIAAEDQLVRVELELSRLQAEEHTKLAERKAVQERLAKLDELESQLKSRPLYQAVEKHLEVAFVPYTQIDGVEKGARVYDCLIGMFICRDVGAVADVVPGEVVLPDPWGNPSRGQYAVLDLADHEAAKSHALRVRRP